MSNIKQISYKWINKDNVPEIMALQSCVFDALDNKDLFRKNTEEMFTEALTMPGFAVGAYDKDKLIAIGIAVDAKGTSEDLNHNLNMARGNSLNAKTINTKNTMVHPDYRGMCLQRKMLQMLHNEMEKNGYEYAIATVHPDNKWSVNNLAAEGYVFDHEQEKYGGLRRAVYIKRLR